MAIVNKIIHSSVVDGPGNRAAVFLQNVILSVLTVTIRRQSGSVFNVVHVSRSVQPKHFP